MANLQGRRFVVTGGSSGIGMEVARRLAEAGAEVAIVARRPETLSAALERLGERVWGQTCDVSDPVQAEQFALAVASRWDGLEGLVNNAGIASTGGLEDTTPETWDQAFAVNVRGPFLITRALLPYLRRGDRPAVVNVSSTLAEKPIPGMVAYNAAKAALNQFTRSAALELAPAIRVNAVMPAVVDTPIHVARGLAREQVEQMAKYHPLKRIGTPADVAAAVLFLLSTDAAWITGAVLPVDGGMLVT